jgi:hypothetical protein
MKDAFVAVTSGQFNSIKMRGINNAKVICKVGVWRRSLTFDQNRVTVTVWLGCTIVFVTDNGYAETPIRFPQ